MTTTVLAYIPSPSSGVLGHLGPLSAVAILIGIIAVLIIGGSLWEARDRAHGAMYHIAPWAVPLSIIGVALALAYIASPVQRVWRLGPLPVRWYAIFIVLGIIVALVIGDRRWEARGGERGVIYDIALWAVPFGLIGGRMYHVITDWGKYFGPDGAGFVGVLRIWDGGLGIWGAVALGGVGAWIGCQQRGIPLPAFGDAIAPGIVLAQGIGRLGNYFNQELYGRPTTLPWGLEIYERRNASGVVSPDLAQGVSTGRLDSIVHPTFLYELLWNLLVFAALIYIDRRFKIGHGRLFAMYVAGYCLGRFWIELMRSDVATHIAGIRINSFTATFVFIGAVVYIMVAPKGREDPSSLKGKPREVEEEEEEGTSVEDFVKELTAVGATTGVVAAAKVAGDAEDEDAKAAADEAESEAEPASEAAAEAEALAYDVAEAPSEDIAEAEEFAEAKEETEAAEAEEPSPEAEPEESEAVSEAEQLAEDVVEAPPEDIAEAAEFAEAKEPAEEGEAAAEAEALGADVAGVPADDLAEAEEFAAEGDQTEAEVEEESAEAEEPPAETEEAEEPSPEAEPEEAAPEEAEAVAEAEGEEAEEPSAETEPPEAEETEAEAESEEPGEELETEDEAEEPETEDAEEAVGDAEAEPSEKEAAEEAEAVIEQAEAAEEEPEAEVLAAEAEPEPAAEAEAPYVEESGGRLSRWLRGRRNR